MRGAVRFPTGTPGLLGVGRQTAQARVAHFQARFRSLGAFQPLRSNDHRFGMQSRSTHQPHGPRHHRLRTHAGLASQHQPLPRGHAVWLRWVEAQLDRPLQHARNKGEFRIPDTRYTVDGYYAATRTVYEFHGCYWHGCPRCHLQRQETHARLLDRTMEDAYRTTQAKVQSLRDRGYTVVEMWECDWHHPVLPYRTGEKLTFPLCRTCVENQLDRLLHDKTWQCPHTDQQRALTGTWCTPELDKAVEQGYVVLKIHEVWHFPQSRQGLFAEHVDTWLKIKEEASGWPAGCTTQESQAQHLHNYARREGIHLDYDQVQHNPGRRALAKMMLNSMWGKFGQRHNKTQVRELTERQPSTTSWTVTRVISVTSAPWLKTAWKSTIPNKTTASPCPPTWTSSWPASPSVGPGSASTRPCSCWGNRSCTSIRTRWCLRTVPVKPVLPWASTWANSKMSWGTATASCSSARRGPRITVTRPGPARPSAKCGDSRSTAKEQRSSITMCCAKTSWTSCTPPWPNPAPHASPSPTPSNARPKTTPCTPDPPTKITVWCAANVWWIPRRLRAIRTATRGWFELATRTLVAQQVERWSLDPRVAGSSLAEGKKQTFLLLLRLSFPQDTLVAQWVERWTFNPRVVGLSPAEGAFKKKTETRQCNGNTPCCGLGISGSNPGLVLFFCLLASLVNIILKTNRGKNLQGVVSFLDGVPFFPFFYFLFFIFSFFYFFYFFIFFYFFHFFILFIFSFFYFSFFIFSFFYLFIFYFFFLMTPSPTHPSLIFSFPTYPSQIFSSPTHPSPLFLLLHCWWFPNPCRRFPKCRPGFGKYGLKGPMTSD